MPLTPIDVQQKTFGTALRGYDLDEVDDFLDDIVTALKDYEQRLRDAQERIATLEMEMTDRGDAEGAIARALVAAQRSADSIIADAKAEADKIVGDAHNEASEMSRARDVEKADAEAEIGRIRGIVDDLRVRLGELTAAVGVPLDQADTTIATALEDLEVVEFEPAVTDFEEPVSSWEQPSAVDELEELNDDSEDEFVESEDSGQSVDDSDDYDDESVEDSEDDEDSSVPDWASTDEDETPVRPWEVG
ncbi:MAG TPA: DivIVA domain-containing protein [Acidimicrobiia bacterium]|nr:DivIVA domain-containing protein [Acidimicrobiia bacterium]